jgi:hypothetical protein
MLQYPYNVGPQSVTIYTPEGVIQGARTPQVIEAIAAGDTDEVIRILTPIRAVASAFNTGDVRVTENAIYYRGRELNNASALRILELQAAGLPVQSEANCLASLMRHDDPRVIESFERFIERWNIPRTPEGRIVLCKGVRDDFFDMHSHSVDWSVGNIVTMSWDDIDRDPSNTCSSGLHCAPLEGARSYVSGAGRLLEVHVWPEHIGALPYDYERNGKVRVVEAYVAREIPRDVAKDFYDFTPIIDYDYYDYDDNDDYDNDDYDNDDYDNDDIGVDNGVDNGDNNTNKENQSAEFIDYLESGGASDEILRQASEAIETGLVRFFKTGVGGWNYERTRKGGNGSAFFTRGNKGIQEFERACYMAEIAHFTTFL